MSKVRRNHFFPGLLTNSGLLKSRVLEPGSVWYVVAPLVMKVGAL